MVSVQVLKLKIVLLSDPSLQLAVGLDQVCLSVIVEDLQLLDYLLLILNDLVLLIDFRLDAANLNLFLIGLKLNQPLKVDYIVFFDADFILFSIDHSSEGIHFAIQSFLTMLV